MTVSDAMFWSQKVKLRLLVFCSSESVIITHSSCYSLAMTHERRCMFAAPLLMKVHVFDVIGVRLGIGASDQHAKGQLCAMA